MQRWLFCDGNRTRNIQFIGLTLFLLSYACKHYLVAVLKTLSTVYRFSLSGTTLNSRVKIGQVRVQVLVCFDSYNILLPYH